MSCKLVINAQNYIDSIRTCSQSLKVYTAQTKSS